MQEICASLNQILGFRSIFGMHDGVNPALLCTDDWRVVLYNSSFWLLVIVWSLAPCVRLVELYTHVHVQVMDYNQNCYLILKIKHTWHYFKTHNTCTTVVN